MDTPPHHQHKSAAAWAAYIKCKSTGAAPVPVQTPACPNCSSHCCVNLYSGPWTWECSTALCPCHSLCHKATVSAHWVAVWPPTGSAEPAIPTFAAKSSILHPGRARVLLNLQTFQIKAGMASLDVVTKRNSLTKKYHLPWRRLWESRISQSSCLAPGFISQLNFAVSKL